METVQHDPRTKELIKQAIYDHLYNPVSQQFAARLEALVIQNTVLGQYTHKSFHYKGELYNCDSTPAPIRRNRLQPQLRPQMDKYLDDIAAINRQEVPYVLGYITRVLNASNHFGDYLRTFPDCLHTPIHKLIAACPCHTTNIPDQKIAEINKESEFSIKLIKQRMVTNLLI